MSTLYCKPGYESPQTILSWDLPSGTFDQVVLVRREKTFPANETDGLEVVRTSSGTVWSDIDGLEPYKFYYYTLFTKSGTDYSYSNSSRSYTVTLDTNFFKTWLYRQLTSQEQELDSLVSYDNDQINTLVQKQSGTFNQYVHLGEDGSDVFYTQERFLRNIGIQLDRTYSLIKMFERTIDVNNTAADYLPSYASLLGITLNSLQDILTKRFRIRSAVAWHAKKGTYNGITDLIYDSLENQITSEIDEKYDNILNYSRDDSGYIDLNQYYNNYEISSGSQDYFLQFKSSDRIIGYDRFVVYIDEDQMSSLSGSQDLTVNRMISELRDYTPASSSFIIDFSSDYISMDASEYSDGITVNDNLYPEVV